MYHISKKLQEIKAVSREKNIIFRRCISGIFTLRKNTAEKARHKLLLCRAGNNFLCLKKSVFQTLDRSGNASAAMNELFWTSGFDGHYRRFAEQSAEVDGIADLGTVGGDQTRRRGFEVDHTDRKFIGNDT